MDAFQGVSGVARQSLQPGHHDFQGQVTSVHPLLRIALLAVAGLFGATPADAAIFWSDSSDPMVVSEPDARLTPAPQPKRHKQIRRSDARPVTQIRETAKPQGPLVIAISIDRQRLKIYDANGLYAESPVSTGMPGHATPMGVFSVIQKQKFHRSNIYSDAPMPFMQRITWSGIAMHAGVLPGHPASHGCIRMPMAFAVKMYGWTRMGARVVIAPGELSPTEFAHPMLAVQKPAATPVASVVPASEQAPPARTGRADTDVKANLSSASLDLKPSMADDRLAKAVAEATGGAKRDQTQTADASGAMIQPVQPPTLSDASPPSTATVNDATATPDAKAFDARAAQFRAATDQMLDGQAAATGSATVTVDTKPTAAQPAETADGNAPAAPKTVASPEPNKDQTRQSDADQAVAGKPDPAVVAAPKRSGPIAVLVSRKDNKLYVRQNFAPLFDVPVTIAASDRPLGTHVFTARADKDDAKMFHWTALSLPVTARSAEDDATARRRKTTGAIDMKAAPLPNSATEALDRLRIPEDAMARINDALVTGSSIIVSDQGIAAGGETGEGTDFIIPLR